MVITGPHEQCQQEQDAHETWVPQSHRHPPNFTGDIITALQAVDAASEAVRTGFRITLADLEARVASEEYVTRGVLTVCLLQLDNGFWLVGKSAPVDPANFNAAYGQQLAHDDALRQAWPLLAFGYLDGR